MEKGVQVRGDGSAANALIPQEQWPIPGVIQTGEISRHCAHPLSPIGIVGAYLKCVCVK